MKYEILKKGRKWFEATQPGKTFKVQIEINETSKNWEVGNIVDVHGEEKKIFNGYGTKVQIFPTSLEEAKAEKAKIEENNRLKEINKWLGYIISNAEEGQGWIYKNGIEKCNELGIKDYPDLLEKMNQAINKVTEYKEKQQKLKYEAKQKEYELNKKIEQEGIEKLANEFLNKISSLSYQEIKRIFDKNELGKATSKVAQVMEEKGIIKIFSHSSGYDDLENDSGIVDVEISYVIDFKKLREFYPFSSDDEIQSEQENKTIKAYQIRDNKEAVILLANDLKKSHKREFTDIKNKAEINLIIFEKSIGSEQTIIFLDKKLNIWFVFKNYDLGSSCSYINFDSLSQENQNLIKQFSIYQIEIIEAQKRAKEEIKIKYEKEKAQKELDILKKEEEEKIQKKAENDIKENKLNEKIKYEIEHLKRNNDEEIKSFLLSTHKRFEIKEVETKTFVEGANVVYAILHCSKKKEKYVYFENFNEEILNKFSKENNIDIY